MKMKFLLLGLTSFFLLFSCKKDNENSNFVNELPSEFPLEVGNAWKYEVTTYENGAIDTSYMDTLYIAGTYQDYFYYSWYPKTYYNLVKNIDNKLVAYGIIYENDTTFYDVPYIWTFYGESGCIDSTYFENYSFNSDIDSFCISILDNREYFGSKWNTYLQKVTYKILDYDKSLTYYNKIGFTCFEYFNENNNLVRKTELVEILENVNIPEMSNDAKKSKDKLLKGNHRPILVINF